MAERNNSANSALINTFVLVNVPDIDDKHEYLSDYIEGTLQEIQVSVRNLSFHPGVPDRVLVMLYEHIDLHKAESLISEEPLEDHQIRVERAENMDAVIAVGEDLKEKLNIFFLKLYFQSEFGNSEEVVTNCVEIPKSTEIAVHFNDSEVTRKVLERGSHMPLPSEGYSIQVRPFFSNFHGLISHAGRHFIHSLEENPDSHLQSEEYTAIQKTAEENQNKLNHSVENELNKETSATADLSSDVDMTPVHEEGKTKDRFTLERSESYSSDNKNTPLPYVGNGSKRLSLDSLQAGRRYSQPTKPESKSVERNMAKSKLSSSDRHTKPLTTDMIESLATMNIQSERDRKTSQVAIGVKPEENKQKTDDECRLGLNKALWKLMEDRIKKGNHEVTYDAEKESLLVKSKNISLFMKTYYELKDSIKECRIPLDENKKMFLNSRYAKESLLSICWNVICHIDKDYMDIYGFYQSSVSAVQHNVTEIFDDFQEANIPNNLSENDYKQRKECYEGYLPVNISCDASFITIIGKRYAVTLVKENLLGKNRVRSLQEPARQCKQSSLQVSGTLYSFLLRFCEAELEDIMKSLKYVWKPQPEGQVVLEFNGSPTDVSKAEENLMEIQKSIEMEMIDVLAELGSTKNSLLIQQLCHLTENDRLYKVQQSFENAYRCVIKNDVRIESLSQATGSNQDPGKGPKMPLNEQQKCLFKINSFSCLEIKNYGNIVEEQADVLVCCIPQKKKLMSTYVGQAFCKAIQGFEDKFQWFPFSDVSVTFTTVRMQRSQDVVVAVMVLPQNPDPYLFSKAVLEILHESSKCSAQSVCFPPLGHGRMMNYSNDFISENFISLLITHVTTWAGWSPKKITFLATNPDLYQKMKHDALSNFEGISESHGSGELSDTFAMIEANASGEYSIQEKKVQIQIVHRNDTKLAPIWRLRLDKLV